MKTSKRSLRKIVCLKALSLLNYILFQYTKHIKWSKHGLHEQGAIKVNLGCGLKIASGWINIDYNLPCLFAKWPTIFLKFLYRLLSYVGYSEFNRPFRFTLSENDFVSLLKSNKFLCSNLKKGIPFKEASIDFYYSSHMIGFSFSSQETTVLLGEIYRTLKKNGLVRLSLVDGDHYWSLIDRSNMNPLNDNCYRFADIVKDLKLAGFVNVDRCSFKCGKVPEMNILDDYSPDVDNYYGEKTMYIEATKQ
jgi:hypothetical protein